MGRDNDTERRQAHGRRTAGEAGWHVSRYNLSAKVPESKYVAIANLFRGTCAEYTPIEMYLLSVLDELDEHHPIIERFAKRGIITKVDELAALEAMGRAACARPQSVSLTICPTMGCNFDCPYCFENHVAGKMAPEVQDDVVALATRMLDAAQTNSLRVTWFGGEPLLAPDVIESLSARLVALVEERGGEYKASVITNGYLLTQKNAAMLHEAKVSSAQVTLDGIGPAHDATRHLAGGGATFERIVSNLRAPLAFTVNLRHNVHAGNRDQVDDLKAFVEQLAKESGNTIAYYPAPVSDSTAANKRGKQVGLLCDGAGADIGIRQDAGRFAPGRGHYCGAHVLWGVGIDERGNLQKCWEAIDKPELSFGTAHDWDPADPLNTASDPNNLIQYLNTALPTSDDECRTCVWLPACAGGCPHKRLFAEKSCVPYRYEPEAYVLALHARIGERKPGSASGGGAPETTGTPEATQDRR